MKCLISCKGSSGWQALSALILFTGWKILSINTFPKNILQEQRKRTGLVEHGTKGYKKGCPLDSLSCEKQNNYKTK